MDLYTIQYMKYSHVNGKVDFALTVKDLMGESFPASRFFSYRISWSRWVLTVLNVNSTLAFAVKNEEPLWLRKIHFLQI